MCGSHHRTDCVLAHATAAAAAATQVWDLSSRKVIRSYEGHGGGVSTVLFHPDGTCIASGSTDGSLKVRGTSMLALITKQKCWYRAAACLYSRHVHVCLLC